MPVPTLRPEDPEDPDEPDDPDDPDLLALDTALAIVNGEQADFLTQFSLAPTLNLVLLLDLNPYYDREWGAMI